MRKIMEHLLALQNFQFNARGQSLVVQAEVAQRRAEVPTPVLAHFDRMAARGKKGVAVVRHGVCTACHMQITTGKLSNLAAGSDICLCDNCGRYLYLPEAEKVALSATQSSPSGPVNQPLKRTVQHVA